MMRNWKISALGLAGLMGFALLFQNCAKPLNLPDPATNTTTTTTAASTAGTGTTPQTDGTSAPLTGAASTGTVYPNDTVTLTASGGTAPYSFVLISGSGSLASNLYLAGAPSVVAIEVTDANRSSFVLSFTVQPRSCTAAQPTATQSQACGSGFSGNATQNRTVTCNVSTGNWDVGAWSSLNTSACIANTCQLDGTNVPVNTTTTNCSQSYFMKQTQYNPYTITCQSNGLWSTLNTKSASANNGCPQPVDGGGG